MVAIVDPPAERGIDEGPAAPAGPGGGLEKGDGPAQPGQADGGRQAGQAGADHPGPRFVGGLVRRHPAQISP